ncbi:stage III sporulation protein AD [Clostridium sp. MSJ-8]|uniref:stage III sporulation protein AD n=1 Tax=Clostridium sp. MSJ-8 TaxID=2841510 RepID=UPI001C0F0C90|nr:stage III sporulation protein AD [Clostridium sp. MSJ-8]MBU5487534.1 stage III sporulation protein AD [Clostridium sp. MSJ-8]
MFLKIIAFALISLFMVLLFKDKRSDLVVLILLVSGISIFIFAFSELKGIISFLQELSETAGINIVYLELVIKILGIAYISSFCSEICKDAGAGSLASKVELVGKIFILILSLPILRAVLDTIIQIL